MTKASLILHKCLRQNSATEPPYIIDGITNIEVWEEGKPYLAVGYFKLWPQQKGLKTSLTKGVCVYVFTFKKHKNLFSDRM